MLNKFIFERHALKTRNLTIKKLKNLNILFSINDILANPQFQTIQLNNIEQPILLPTYQLVFDFSNLLDKNEIEFYRISMTHTMLL